MNNNNNISSLKCVYYLKHECISLKSYIEIIHYKASYSNSIPYRSEPLSEGEFNPDDIQLMQTNYNGWVQLRYTLLMWEYWFSYWFLRPHSAQNFYSPSIDPNILHPDVIVDTDNLSDCSSTGSLHSGKRKLSTSTDGDSTNYELIEYLKRREKRDEELLKRMDAREERLMTLLERAVMAFETLAAGKTATASSSSSSSTTEATSTSAPATTPAAASNGPTDTYERAAAPATPPPPLPPQTEHSSSPAPALPLPLSLPAVVVDEAIVVVPDEEDAPVVNCTDDDPE